MPIDSLTIKDFARQIGFDSCGICDINIDNDYYLQFENWLNNGSHAEMQYLQRNKEVRKNPKLLVENAKSVISVLLNYYSEEKLNDSSITISKYAHGKDYHKILKEKLYLLLKKIKVISPKANGRVFVDSAPVFERYFAWKSGLGFIGKNNCLISENFGSWVFIGEIIIDVELQYDKPQESGCGNCKICIDSCPSGALSENYLNAQKCISYHTIENKADIPKEVKINISTQIFGCDICQNTCPYNKNSTIHNNSDLKILPMIKDLNLDIISSITDQEFNALYSESPLFRAGRNKLIRNFNVKK